MIFSRRSLLGSAAAVLAAGGPRAAFPAGSGEADALPTGFRQMTVKAGKTRLGEAASAEVDAILVDGSAPAPVLRIKAGEDLRLRLANGLDAPTGLHWRGVRGPIAMDGFAPMTSPVAPGGHADIAFAPPDAGTFLYLAAGTPLAGTQQALGLAGVLVVEEREAPKVDRDLVVALADHRGDASDKQPLVTVNGKLAPETVSVPPGSRLRLRLANLSTTRILLAGFEGLKPLVIAIDGQPCDAFEPVRATVPLGPGARFDIVCDLPKVPGDSGIVLHGDADLRIVTFKTDGEAVAEKTPFTGLPPNPALPTAIALEKAARADLVIAATGPADKPTGWSVNGAPGSAEGKPLVSVKRGSPVSLGFVNKTGTMQPIHVHGHVVRQLHPLDDGWEPYWRDSVIVPPGKTVRVAFVADNPGRWMVESALPDWSAAGLWGWFEVK